MTLLPCRFTTYGVLAVALSLPEQSEDAKQPAKVLVTISKETTVITKPLRPDEYPNYVQALNDKYSAGVTPDNNAAVPLLKAMGPFELEHGDIWEPFCKAVGIDPLPRKGDYFIPFTDWLDQQSSVSSTRKRDELLNQYSVARSRA